MLATVGRWPNFSTKPIYLGRESSFRAIGFPNSRAAALGGRLVRVHPVSVFPQRLQMNAVMGAEDGMARQVAGDG
jgi:hypothetical protein